MRSGVMTSGDWAVGARDPGRKEFTLSFMDEDGKRVLVMGCVRDERKSFHLLDISTDELVELIP